MTTRGKWSSGLCDCSEDCSSCCLTCCCPCITFGRIAEVVDQGNTYCCVSGGLWCLLYCAGCAACFSCVYRSKLRQQFMLPAKPCNDCLIHCICTYCALCQEYRELNHRGLDPSLGWHGIQVKQSQGVVKPPVGPGEMKR